MDNSHIFENLFNEDGDFIYRKGNKMPIIMDFKENIFGQIWSDELDLTVLAHHFLGKFLDEHPEFKYSCDAVRLYYSYNEDDSENYDIIRSFFKLTSKGNKRQNIEEYGTAD